MSFTSAALLQAMRKLPAPNRYHVAYSGGCDSHTLLHALAAIRQQLPAPVHAIHIHHGLQAAADHWVEHVQRVCDDLTIPLAVRYVDAKARAGDSPEAAARAARLQALRTVVEPGEMILMAHHQDDQAETLLLQLLRGAGLHGQAGMPVCTEFARGWLARPLLTYRREMLQAYAQAQALEWIEDPSNQNTDFDRNYLRHQVVPLLMQRWPTAAATLARAASHQAEAAGVLNEFAVMDWLQIKGEQHTLQISRLQGLLAPRQRNVLRYWLKEVCRLPVPDSRHLLRIQDELLSARDDANPEVVWAGAEVRRYQERLYAMAPQQGLPADWSVQWDWQQPLLLPDTTQCLRASPRRGSGVRRAALGETIEVRFRQGGEQLVLPGRRHHHALKKLLQEWGVPPWLRDRIPLLYVNGELAQVVGHCISADFLATDDEPGMFVEMIPIATETW